jgi:hypothetical protein
MVLPAEQIFLGYIVIDTSFYTQKDKINELGHEQFAAENNKTLTIFYSIDIGRNSKQHQKTNRHFLKNC